MLRTFISFLLAAVIVTTVMVCSAKDPKVEEPVYKRTPTKYGPDEHGVVCYQFYTGLSCVKVK